MIINKSAYERGFKHGCVYKSYIKEVNEPSSGPASKLKYKMLNQIKNVDISFLKGKGLDADGLPYLEKKLEHGSAELCVYDTVLAKPKF